MYNTGTARHPCLTWLPPPVAEPLLAAWVLQRCTVTQGDGDHHHDPERCHLCRPPWMLRSTIRSAKLAGCIKQHIAALVHDGGDAVPLRAYLAFHRVAAQVVPPSCSYLPRA